ncbi:MAG: HDOD domain-containing protein [Fibrobacterota bacterium]
MSILAQLRQIPDLPTLPEVVLKIQSLIQSDTSDASMLARIIEQDPPLASKILKVANSSFYGPSNRRISNVALAVARLGFNEVRNISQAVSLIRSFPNQKHQLNHKEFWRHSLCAANLTSIIADMATAEANQTQQQNLFICGLIHDIGILIEDQFFHEQFSRIFHQALSEEKSFLQAESDILKRETHAMVGSALLEFWKLSPSAIAAVRYHHEPERCPQNYRYITYITSIAEYVLCNGRLGSFEGATEKLGDEIWESIGISHDMVPILFEMVEKEVDKTDMILSLDPPSSKQELPFI